MFKCERCGSGYSATHAATIENCPRCMIRDRTAAPLTFKLFEQSGPRKASMSSPDPSKGAASPAS